MIQIMTQHVALAGVGAGMIFLAALILRLLASQDAVLRYRFMVGALGAAAMLLPIQALTAALATQSASAQRDIAPLATPTKSNTLASGSVREAPLPAAPSLTAMPSLSALVPLVRSQVPTAAAQIGTGWASVMLLGYVVGAGVVMGWHAVRAMAVRRILKQARPVTDERVLRVWGRVISSLRRPPELLASDAMHAPACAVLGRRAVLVPVSCADLDDDMLQAALCHEVIHLRRHDGVIALIAAAMTALLWFQPLVWVFDRLLRADREHSCDALVVRATRRPRSYAMALLRFCDPGASRRGGVSLVGFESARSLHRRISMLAHAHQPAARSRRMLVLGAGVIGVLSASAAHALLTVAAEPNSAASTDVAAVAGTTRSVEGAKDEAAPKMSAEFRALPNGRADAEVYERLVRSRVIAPDALAPGDPLLAFAIPMDSAPGVRKPDAWVIDQETVVSAPEARAEDETLVTSRARLSLPGGSKLRAVVEGRSVRVEPTPGGGNRITVIGGGVRVVDDVGVTRVHARAASDRDDATLTLTSTLERGTIIFELAAAEGNAPVPTRVETRSAVPEGERRETHGSVRWKLEAPEKGTGKGELKMRWHYEVQQLQKSQGC